MSYRVRRDDPQAHVRGGDFSYRDTASIRLSSARAAGASLADEGVIAARRINLLPTTAETFYDNRLEPFCWGPTLKALLAGTHDKEGNSPLVLLRAHETTLVRHIYSYVSNQWARHVRLTIPAALVGRTHGADTMLRFDHGRNRPNWHRRELLRGVSTTSYAGADSGFVSFSRCGFALEFPEPAGRNVSMMPFHFGDKPSLPDDLQCYRELIENLT
jgi:hypothetical protein